MGPSGVGLGTRFLRAALASSPTKDSGSSSGRVRASPSSQPSLQGSVYQVSIFLPVYW